MPDLGQNDDWLRSQLDGIEQRLERQVEDTHDYSSLRYSARDDGYNEGVYDALEAVRDVLLRGRNDA